MTLAEKILAAHTGKKKVAPGELVSVRVDLVMANDITAPIAIREFRRLGLSRVFDPKKVVLVPSHFAPNKDINSAGQAKLMREFAREQGCIYFEQGQGGIEHVLLPQKGMVVPGYVYVGADSHTCTSGALGAFATGMGSTDIAVAMATGEIWMRVPHTIKLVYHGKLNKWVRSKDLILYTIGQIGVDGALYASMEFHGDALKGLSMDSRFTMSNMAVEAGAKVGLFPVDEVTLEYVRARSKRPYTVYEPDLDAQYAEVHEFDVTNLEPQIAFPHLPSKTRPLSQVGDIKIDQVFIGSCTNGKIEDLREAASIMRGKYVAPWVRCIVIPASNEIYLQALREGLIETFVEAGAAFSTSTCGPCLGGYMGVLAEGERCVSTSNRNFVGRMGHPKSEVYLASPAVAAASAILGRIAGPAEVVH
ncbi:MAG: 3-isopropylmalate dehydratase large subunit [Chloroflexi bacterium]|nr:3-isopropylmalate dehydratase large subunit [Chloroflexota bacterium]